MWLVFRDASTECDDAVSDKPGYPFTYTETETGNLTVRTALQFYSTSDAYKIARLWTLKGFRPVCHGVVTPGLVIKRGSLSTLNRSSWTVISPIFTTTFINIIIARLLLFL